MKWSRGLLALFALLLAAGIHWPNLAHATPKDQIELSVDADDRMTISLKVGEKDVSAVLDTAATYFMIDHAVLDDFNSSALEGPINILGLDGIREFPRTEVGPMVTGNTPLGTVRAAINSNSDFIGHRTIVPLSALPGRTVDFNFAARKISFYDHRPERQSRRNIVSRVKYKEINGLIFIPVRLNGTMGHALIDTGSNVTYVNHAFAEASKAKFNLDITQQLFGIAATGIEVRVFSAQAAYSWVSHDAQRFDILASDPPSVSAPFPDESTQPHDGDGPRSC